MRLQHIVRTLIYSVIAIALAAVAILGLTIYRSGLQVPSSILNSRVAQSIASRYGVRYKLESLQIGCLGQNCSGEVNAGALDVEIQIPEPLRIHLNETHSSRGNPLTASGLEVRSGSRPPLIRVDRIQADLPRRQAGFNGLQVGTLSTVDNVEFDAASKQVTARGIRFSSANVDTIRLQGWETAADNYIVLNRLDVDGVRVSPAARPASSLTICQQLPTSADLGGDTMEPFRPLLPLLLKDIQILHGDLLRIAVAIGIAILILKLLSVLWMRSWLLLPLAAIPAVAPFALYFQLRTTLLVATLSIVVIAILLRILVYRRGERWYQRWEPFVVDIASVLVLLPLLGYGFELPSFPEPPAGFQLDRIEVANLAGASAPQFSIPQTSIRGVRVALPGAEPQIEIGVASIQIPKASIIAPPSSRIRLDGVSIDDVHLAYDPKFGEIGDIAAHLKLAGLFESDALQRELRNIEYLRGIDLRSRVGFDVDVRASGPGNPPEVSNRFPRSGRLIAVNAAVRLQPVECTASFDVATRIQSEPLMMTARADGNIESVHIRSIRSLPGSPVQIAEGSGSVTLAGAPKLSLNLESIGGSIGSTRLDVDFVGIAASVPAPGKKGIQAATIAIGPASIKPASGLNVNVNSTNIHVDRMPDRRSVPVTFETRIENVQLQDPVRRIAANFPSLVTRVTGQTTSETIPRQFNGTVDFAASGANPSDELIGTNRPIVFRADLWKGTFDIPDQEIIFREAMLSESRTEIPVQFKLAGRLSAIVPKLNADVETKAALSHFEQAMGSTRIAFNDAQVSGRLDSNEERVTASLNYGIGSTRIALSPGPTALCLDEISTLNVSASGTISQIFELGGLPTQAPTPCALLPTLPPEIRFQISGNYPVRPQDSLIRIDRENGTGFRIHDIGSEIRNLQIRDGRLVSMDTGANITGIGNLQGLGVIDVQADLRQSKDSLEVDSKLSANGTVLLEAALASTPTMLSLDATQPVPADRILDQIKPFLADLKIDLGGVDPKARLTHLHADANFENGEFLNAAIEARLDRGAIASVESPGLRANVSTSATGTEPLLSLSIGRASEPNGLRRIVASAGVPGAVVHAVTDNKVTVDADADLSVIAQGSLWMSVQPPASPVLNKIFDISSGLSRQVSLLMALSTTSPSQPMNNVEWNAHFSQNSPESSLLRLESDTLEIHISDASFDVAWDGTVPQDRSRIAVSTPVHSRIGLEGNEVLMDLFSPIALSYALNGQAESRIDSNIPIQVAFADRLNRSPDNSRSLWNQEYYRQFWRAHPPKFSSTVVASPIDFNEVLLGPISVREIRFPLEPLRIVIGYADALQVGLPFSGRALYGSVDGDFESNVTTSNGVATFDTRLNLELKNIQAGAVGSTMSGDHLAIVEDELDGNVSVRVDGLAIDRDTLPAIRAGNVSAADLEKLGMSVHLRRSREAASLPGVFQASSNVHINLVNELLNQIIKDLRLPAPPRALTYKNLALDFDVDQGRVRTGTEVFKLGGVQLFSSNVADVTAEVRAHLGRPGERIMLGSLMNMLGSLGAAETGGQ